MTSPDATTGGTLPRDLLANPRLSQWLRVCPDGSLEVRVGKVELGQGIATALAQIAAAELDVPLQRLRMLPPRTDDSPDEGVTAGSMSVAEAGAALRVAAANVRLLFLQAAARRAGADPADLCVVDGHIRDSASRAVSSYAELAASVDLDVPARADVAVKDPDDTSVVGRSVPRLDLPDKIAGLPRFLSDLRPPGLLFGRVLRPPAPRARLLSVDASVLGGLDVRLVRDGSFLGLVGPDEAEVTRALSRLPDATAWSRGDALPDARDLTGFLKAGPHDVVPVVADEGFDWIGDVWRPAGSGSGRVRARYSRPFLAHASIAPSCGIARWDSDGRVEVWSSSQAIHRLRDAIAAALDLDPDRVTVEHAQNAGCYGHNGADDAAFDAVLLAREFPGRPVQVLWSRADELTWSPFGSAMAVEVEAELDDSGRLRWWRYDVWSQGHTARPGYAGVPGLLAGASLARPLPTPPAEDPPPAAGRGSARNAVPIYDVGLRKITAHRVLDTPVRSSSLRALGAFLNVFGIESFLDECAARTNADPLAFRLAHLRDTRARTVLEVAAEAAGWATAAEEGTGLGLGFARYKDRGAYCAVVADVAAEHEIRVRRLTIAVDVGRIVNPDGVRNQIEGGATQAVSWTLKERVRFGADRVTSVDWETYPILRFGEAPEIRVELVSNPHLPSVGAGEAAQGPTAAAIGNAVAAAVGVRVRDLPITTEAVVAAIEGAEQPAAR